MHRHFVLLLALLGAMVGSPPAFAMRTQGYVKWYNAAKGFGFITSEKGDDLFVSLPGTSLCEGALAEFDVVQGPKGLQAANVFSECKDRVDPPTPVQAPPADAEPQSDAAQPEESGGGDG